MCVNNIYNICRCLKADEVDFILPFIAIFTNPIGNFEIPASVCESFSYEIICYEGTVEVQIKENSDLLVTAKQLIVINATSHMKGMSFSNDFKGHLMVQTNEFSNSIIIKDVVAISEYYRNPIAFNVSDEQSRQHYLFFEWFKYALRRSPANAEDLIRTLLRVSTHIFSDYKADSTGRFICRSDHITTEFMRILEEADNDEYTVKHFSDILRIPPRSLARAVKQSTGHTITEYILKQRIARAKQLISSMTINTPMVLIADKLGFSSLASFSRFFKTNTGISPSEYRNLRH